MNRNSILTIQKMKDKGDKIVALTAYDCQLSRIFDKSGIDIILVGDSLGMVFQGKTTTLPVTLDDIIYHTKIVVNNTTTPLIIADLPFGTYQGNINKAIDNSMRVIKETGCNAIKVEGGEIILPLVEKLSRYGIPVFGHLGLMPQSINKFGNYQLRGKTTKEASTLIEDCINLEKAGVCGIILEKIPATLAENVTNQLHIPTIGIGAGNQCSGQILVATDFLGMDESINFKFVRKYADLNKIISEACSQYIKDVKSQNFPNNKESY